MLRLPAVRGSRQSVNVKLATAILANASVYLKYDDQVRIDGDPNKLICSQWGGLHSRCVAGALKARSLVDVAFCQPLTFFTHHVTVTLPIIRSIMHCGVAWLLEVQQLATRPARAPLRLMRSRSACSHSSRSCGRATTRCGRTSGWSSKQPT